ncbi:MAG: ligase-associated DNA damage response endonuclease PdeM [bacterium]
MSATITLAGELVALCAERAMYWPRLRILLVADPHFGKDASFRALGVRVPEGATANALARLDVLVERLAPRRIVFLGDFLHAREGRNPETFAALAAWRSVHARIAMHLVRGNHDRRAGDPPANVGIVCVDGPVVEPPFALMHHPTAIAGAYVLSGHLHPCAVLVGPGRQRERLPCFWIGRDIAVLPAFGEFTGCAEIAPDARDQVWVVAGDEVVAARAPGSVCQE